MSSSATEVLIRAAVFERRMAPLRAHLNQTFTDMFAKYVKLATRRKSKGYRKHVRRMKAAAR